MPLLALFIAVPLIEITLFIQVGSLIGLGWVLFTVVLTAIIGTTLVRRQGRDVLTRLQSAFSGLRDPSEDLAHGAMILFSGALLLTPGFFTDAVGFLLLVPRVRAFVFQKLRQRVKVTGFQTPGQQHGAAGGPGATRGPAQDADVVDAEYHEIQDPQETRDKPSGWTRH